MFPATQVGFNITGLIVNVLAWVTVAAASAIATEQTTQIRPETFFIARPLLHTAVQRHGGRTRPASSDFPV
jgi:hypothetical protein